MTYDWINPKLAIGSAPIGSSVRRSLHHHFDMLVLCAREYQPRGESFPDLEVVHAGFSDDGSPATAEEFALATHAAQRVAAALRSDQSVLVTCMMGLNRSGLVCALALRLVTGCSGREAMAIVRAARTGALFNPWFEAALERLPARRRAPGLARGR